MRKKHGKGQARRSPGPQSGVGSEGSPGVSEPWREGAPAYPPPFVERMRSMLNEELPAFLSALGAPEVGLRVNTLRLTTEEFEFLRAFATEKLAYPAEGYIVPAEERAGRHPYHAAGLYYIQDPGAMAVGALVGAEPGERVLDIAAAPGGKATQIAARMANRGVLIANDVSRTRAVELGRNLERCGVWNAVVTCEPVERLAHHRGGFFDRVLVDAPCSGESMFGRSAAALADWNPEVVLGCARRQSGLLRHAAALVRSGGRLVYSTCTFSREENEDVIGAFLEECEDFAPEEIGAVPGAEILAIGRTGHTVPAALRLWPHRTPGAGHFVVTLRRVREPASTDKNKRAPSHGRKSPLRPASPASLRLYNEFMRETYPGYAMETEKVVAQGDVLFRLPSGVPRLDGLHVLRPGLELGTVRPDRFEPSHALSLAVAPSRAHGRVELEVGDPRVQRYLEGHPLDAPGRTGWVPVTVSGFALGWGKRVAGVVKNRYPKGLRLPG